MKINALPKPLYLGFCLKESMIDIKILRENPNLIIEDLKKRKDKDKVKLVRTLKAKDELWRKLKFEEDNLRSQRNKNEPN